MPDDASLPALAERRRSVDARETELWNHAVAAHNRLSVLGEASRALNETLDAETVLARLAELIVARVAEWCAIDLLDGAGRLRLEAARDREPRRLDALRELRARFGADALQPVSGDPGRARLLRRFEPGQFMTVPLAGPSGPLGRLTFGRRAGSAPTSADLELARELGQRAGAAMENARLYEKARRADELLSRALSANRMVAWSWDLRTGYVERSANAAAVYGVAEEDLGSGLELIHPDDRPRYEGVLSRLLETGGSYVERFRTVRRDGSVAWMEEHASMSGAQRVSGVITDITAQKLVEDQLRLEEEVSRVVTEAHCVKDAFPRLLAAVGETMGWTTGFGWLSPDGRTLAPAGLWSRAAEIEGAAEARPAAPGPLACSVFAEGHASWVCSVPRPGDGGGTRQRCAFAFPLLGGRGALGVLEFHGDGPAIGDEVRADLFERLGRQIGALLERKAAEAELERQRREQKLILDSVPAMIWYKDGSNRVLRCNQAAAEWLGKTVEQVEGSSAFDLFPERGQEYHRDDLAVLRGGKARLGLVEECVRPSTGAKCWIRRDLIPLTDETGRAVSVIIFAVDITKIKRAEQSLRESERIQREFVANVSHEFRTPVAAIKGFAETLRRGGMDDVKNRLTFVRTIESHADRLDWLVQDLLNLSKLGSGMVKVEREVVPLRRFLRNYLNSVSAVIRRSGCRVELDAPEDLEALAAPPHLIQVLDNLLSNAIKYGRKGGVIRFRAAAHGGGARLTVHDEGEGIPAEHLPRLFDRFYRVQKGDGGGSTGLGLHIVKTIMEAQGGGVSVESERGRGTSFHLQLKRAR